MSWEETFLKFNKRGVGGTSITDLRIDNKEISVECRYCQNLE